MDPTTATETAAPVPAVATMTALQKSARSLQKRACKKHASLKAMEALIQKWHPAYVGIYRRTEDYATQPNMQLVLWWEREYLNDKPDSFMRFMLEERGKWRFWDSFSALSQALTVLHVLRALSDPSRVCRETLTLTVQVDDPSDRSDRRKYRYIDVETGREWLAQCWAVRRAERAAREAAEQKGAVAA